MDYQKSPCPETIKLQIYPEHLKLNKSTRDLTRTAELFIYNAQKHNKIKITIH